MALSGVIINTSRENNVLPFVSRFDGIALRKISVLILISS